MAMGQTAQELETIQRQQDQLLRQEEEQRREQERLRKLRELQPPQEPETENQKQDGSNEHCVLVNEIRLEGITTILSEGEAEKITTPFIDSCLSVKDLEQLLQLFNDRFRDDGYITSRAYLPQQDLSDGKLIIAILEGKVESLTLGENGSREQRQLFFAFPNREGDILNLRDVEQGLDQINRLASNNAKMQIEPGEKAGTSVVAVSNEPSRRFRVKLGRENSGTSSTGKLKDTAQIVMDDIVGMNDNWSLSLAKNARGHNHNRQSRSVSGTISIPFGYSTLTYSGSYYEYASIVEGTSQDFLTSGLSTTDKLELSHILHRDQNSKTRLDLAVTRKKARNFLEDVLLESSSRNLTVGHLSLAHSTRFYDGILSVELQHDRGLKILDAQKDLPSQDHSDPKAQYRKWLLDASYARGFKLGEDRLNWTSTTSWQYAQDTLFGTERIGVGGQYSVRGFREDTLSADTGGYWRNELALQVKGQDWGVLDPVLGTLEPYAALDWGWVKKDRSETEEKGTMSGAALGLRNKAKYFDFDIFYARGLAAPRFISKENHELHFSAKLVF